VSYVQGGDSGHVRRQFELARPDLDACQHADSPLPCFSTTLLRQFIPPSMPDGIRKQMNLYEVAEEIGHRLSAIFLKDEQGKRAVHGMARKFQEDPHSENYPLFYEYYHGDTGAGVGAIHQTGMVRGDRAYHASVCVFLRRMRYSSRGKGQRKWAGRIPQPKRKR